MYAYAVKFQDLLIYSNGQKYCYPIYLVPNYILEPIHAEVKTQTQQCECGCEPRIRTDKLIDVSKRDG